MTIGIARRDNGGGVESVAFTFTKGDYHRLHTSAIHKELWYSGIKRHTHRVFITQENR